MSVSTKRVQWVLEIRRMDNSGFEPVNRSGRRITDAFMVLDLSLPWLRAA
ncbi:hypothetical protein [Pseudomonas cichorii]|nr:hypothetical protein [Pseudomonas cichorii]